MPDSARCAVKVRPVRNRMPSRSRMPATSWWNRDHVRRIPARLGRANLRRGFITSTAAICENDYGAVWAQSDAGMMHDCARPHAVHYPDCTGLDTCIEAQGKPIATEWPLRFGIYRELSLRRNIAWLDLLLRYIGEVQWRGQRGLILYRAAGTEEMR